MSNKVVIELETKDNATAVFLRGISGMKLGLADLEKMAGQSLGRTSAGLKELGGAAAFMGGQTGKTFERLTSGWMKFGTVLAVGYAVKSAVSGIWDLHKEITALVDGTADFAGRIGISVEALSKLDYAAKMTDAGVETLHSSLQKMARSISEAAQGMGKAKDAFKALGLDIAKLAVEKPDQQFMDIVRAMERVGNQGDRVRLAFQIFGKGSGPLVQMLNEGTRGLNRFFDEAEKSGNVIGAEMAENAEKAEEAMKRLDAAVLGLKIQFAQGLSPAITGIIEDLTMLLVTFEKGIALILGEAIPAALEKLKGNYRRTIEGLRQEQAWGNLGLPPSWAERIGLGPIQAERGVGPERPEMPRFNWRSETEAKQLPPLPLVMTKEQEKALKKYEDLHREVTEQIAALTQGEFEGKREKLRQWLAEAEKTYKAAGKPIEELKRNAELQFDEIGRAERTSILDKSVSLYDELAKNQSSTVADLRNLWDAYAKWRLEKIEAEAAALRKQEVPEGVVYAVTAARRMEVEAEPQREIRDKSVSLYEEIFRQQSTKATQLSGLWEQYKTLRLRQIEEEADRLRKLGVAEDLVTAAVEAQKKALDRGLEPRRGTREWIDMRMEEVWKGGARDKELDRSRREMELQYAEELGIGRGRGARMGLEQFTDDLGTQASRWADISRGAAESITGSMGDAFSDMILGTKSVSEAFAEMANQIIADITRIMIRKAIVEPIAGGILGAFGIGHEGGTISTEGIERFHAGGKLGPRERVIIVEMDEVVIRKEAARKIPRSFWEGINRMHEGGFVGGSPRPFIMHSGGPIPQEPQRASGEQPKIQINMVNKSGVPLQAEAGDIRFDGRGYVADVWLDLYHNNRGFRQSIGRR